MTTITDEDRAAAATYLWGLGFVSRRDAAEILAGLWDDTNHVTAFADHRNAGLERAAELWERHKYNGSFGEAIRAEKEKP